MEAFQVRAVSRYVRISPQKVRRILGQIRGKQVDEALSLLEFMPQKAARIVSKTIKSAVANAVENYGLSREDLYIAGIFADQGPTRRWRRFAARGRVRPIRRRYSHITVIVAERTP